MAQARLANDAACRCATTYIRESNLARQTADDLETMADKYRPGS